jgi:hypothetical protein
VKKLICLLLSSIFIIQDCFGSSCCGSSVSMPALITTGEKWKFQTVFSQSERIFQISADSEAIKLSKRNQLDVFKSQIKTASLLKNDWQVFSQINYFDRGIGDLEFGFGRELLLSEEFKTFVWAQLILPTGKSIYKINNPNEAPTGSGFWIPGIGASLTRTFGTWDASTSVYFGRGIAEKIKGIEIKPGLQSFAQIGLGKNYGNWRIGSSLEYQRENGKKIQSGANSVDSFSWPVSLSLSYLNKGDIWTASLSDETLLGPTQNTYLNRGVSVSFVRRFF